MSYFDVKLDGISIHDPQYREMTLKDAKVSLPLGEAGSFTFTLPKEHVFADAVTPFGSTIEVFEDGNSIFYGRPLAPRVDMYGRKTYRCEGPIAFLNDVICPPGISGMDVEMGDAAYLTFLVNYYNTLVPASRKIYVNSNWPISPVNPPFLHEWNYKSAKYYLQNDLLKYIGGYFYTTRESGTTWLNWIAEPSYQNTQVVELGKNVLDAMMEGQPFFTAAIASGKQIYEELIPVTGEVVTMQTPVTMSQTVLDKYGFMCTYLDAGETDSVQTLETYCSNWLANQQIAGRSFDIGALDLSMVDSDESRFLFGRYSVHVEIPTMGLDEYIPIVGMDIDLNTGRKRLKVGDTEYQTMTNLAVKTQEQTKENTEAIESGDIGGGGGGGGGGDNWIHQVNGITRTTGTINFTKVT